MQPHTSIFEDLEISTDGFMDVVYKAEEVQAFKDRVISGAKVLEDIMDADTSVSALAKDIKNKARKNSEVQAELSAYFGPVEKQIYEDCETLDLEVVYGLIGALKSLANDLENTIHDRLKREASNTTSALYDKKQAHMQHKRLRDAWDSYRNFIKTFHGELLPSIKARPGNYTATITDTLMYRFEDGKEYYNPRAVAKRLGIWHEKFTYSDLMEYLEENPDSCEVIKINL